MFSLLSPEKHALPRSEESAEQVLSVDNLCASLPLSLSLSFYLSLNIAFRYPDDGGADDEDGCGGGLEPDADTRDDVGAVARGAGLCDAPHRLKREVRVVLRRVVQQTGKVE